MINRQDLKELWDLLEWQDRKQAVVEHATLSRDALHVYIALLIYLGACWLFRWKAGSVKPWLLVLAFQMINEIFDMRVSYEDDGVIWIWASVKDMVNTMIAPSMLLLAARFGGVFGTETKNRPKNGRSGDKPEM